MLHCLCFLQTLSHLSCVSNCKTILCLHTILILSKLNYGCQVHSSVSPCILSKVNLMHQIGLLSFLPQPQAFPLKQASFLFPIATTSFLLKPTLVFSSFHIINYSIPTNYSKLFIPTHISCPLSHLEFYLSYLTLI